MAIRLMDVSIDEDNDIVVSERSHRAAQDTFIWQADQATVSSFSLDFDGQWPFPGPPEVLQGAPGFPVAKNVSGSAALTDYKYTVNAMSNDLQPANELDPHIIVDNMGGADGFGGADPAKLQAIGEGTFKSVVDTLVQLQEHTKGAAADGKRFFFPFGIQSIAVAVTGLAGVNINITVSGQTVA